MVMTMLPLFVASVTIATMIATATAVASASPEIATKSGKSTVSTTVQQQLQPQQQQQQQKATQLRNQQDVQLNSINAYAKSYDSSPATGAAAAAAYNSNYNQVDQQQQSNLSAFKPSYSYANPIYTQHQHQPSASTQQLPASISEMETNFQPMPPSIQSGATPVIMQYLPQSHMHDGVQYLQLIPTRPLMVPISPYMPQQAQQSAAAYHQALASSNLGEYSPRHSVLSAIPAAGPPAQALSAVHGNSVSPYGLQSYAQSLQGYRNYRINREIANKNLSPIFSLNIHEYMPTPNDPPQQYVIRGRP